MEIEKVFVCEKCYQNVKHRVFPKWEDGVGGGRQAGRGWGGGGRGDSRLGGAWRALRLCDTAPPHLSSVGMPVTREGKAAP